MKHPSLGLKQRAEAEPAGLTLATPPTIYGCSELFDVNADDALMSLSFAGTNDFLDWLGWTPTTICTIKRYFLTYSRAEGDGQGSASAGWLADPCADPNGVEWGTCDFYVDDFARLRREGPVRDITKVGLKFSDAQPRYRLDGTLIADDREFDMRLCMEVIMQDLSDMVMNGNINTAGQFEGLKRLIKTGYTDTSGRACELMDSIIVDWNDNGTDGGAGITWNSLAVGSGYNLVDILHHIYRRFRKRIRMAPSLRTAGLRTGDMVIVMPEDFIPCLLDAYTCWSVCSDGDMSQMMSLEGRAFRNNLNGGAFGAGRIFLDGFEIPILPYDYGTFSTVNKFDIFFMTGSVGAVKLVHGEFNDMTETTSRRPDRYATDRGMLLTWRVDDQTCEKQEVEMQPRLVCWAPWAQARIQDITCDVPGGVISADQWSECFPYP